MQISGNLAQKFCGTRQVCARRYHGCLPFHPGHDERIGENHHQGPSLELKGVLLDDFVGARKYRERYGEVERLRGLEVDHELEFRRLLHGQITGPQFHHVIDIAPTILEAVGLPMPTEIDGVKQKPIEGVSMVYTFEDANA